MKKLIAFSLFFCALSAAAQNATTDIVKSASALTINKDPKDTAYKKWKTGGLFSLNLAQGSQSDWAAGGDNFSLTLTTYINAHAFYKKGKTSWDNNFDFNLGYVNTTSLGSRKNDDRVDLLSKYGYAISKKWDLSTLFDFRTQFFKGYSYPTDSTKIFSSTLLSPAYLLLGVGFNYHPVKGFSVFLSPAMSRSIIVADDSLSAVGADGVDSGRHLQIEIGAYASIQYNSNPKKIVTYSGRLDLYSNYLDQPQNIALYMTNFLAVKLSKWFSFTYNLNLIYDDKVRLFGPNHDSPALQLNSLVGVGLLVKL
jgi:hypothetical protein